MYYYERTKDSLDHKLKTKKEELRWLKEIRERHISDIRYVSIERCRNYNKMN